MRAAFDVGASPASAQGRSWDVANNRLAKSYGDARLEAAARRALAIGANSYRSIESILNHRLDEHPPEPIEPAAPIEHHNIRGSDYYS